MRNSLELPKGLPFLGVKEVIKKIKEIIEGIVKNFKRGKDKGSPPDQSNRPDQGDIIDKHIIEVFEGNGKITDKTVREVMCNKGEITILGGNPIIHINEGVIKVTDAHARIVTNEENGVVHIEDEEETKRVMVGTNKGTIKIRNHGRLIFAKDDMQVLLNPIVYPYDESKNSFFAIKKAGETVLKAYKENNARKIEEKADMTEIVSVKEENGALKIVLKTEKGEQHVEVKDDECVIKAEAIVK